MRCINKGVVAKSRSHLCKCAHSVCCSIVKGNNLRQGRRNCARCGCQLCGIFQTLFDVLMVGNTWEWLTKESSKLLVEKGKLDRRNTFFYSRQAQYDESCQPYHLTAYGSAICSVPQNSWTTARIQQVKRLKLLWRSELPTRWTGLWEVPIQQW